MTNTRPLILLTNDDGIASPGLHAAAQAVADLGEIYVVAPKKQQSATGRSLPPTDGLIHEERIPGLDARAYSINGSPATAVLYAMYEILPRLPDIVICGINYGENLGSGITASGTVGAALEASTWGAPSLAVSLETDPRYHYSHSDAVDFAIAALVTRRFACWLLNHRLPAGVDALKIDIPNDASDKTPWRLTRVSRQTYLKPTRTLNAEGMRNEPLGYQVRIDEDALEPDSDIAAFRRERVISVSPITFDLSALGQKEALLASLRELDS
jgi:5'-nucleotidase